MLTRYPSGCYLVRRRRGSSGAVGQIVTLRDADGYVGVWWPDLTPYGYTWERPEWLCPVGNLAREMLATEDTP